MSATHGIHFDFVINDDLYLDFEDKSLGSHAHKFLRKKQQITPPAPATEAQQLEWVKESAARSTVNPFKKPHDYLGIRNGKAAMGKVYVHEYHANGDADSGVMEKHVERSESRAKMLYSLPEIAVIAD